jgi:lipid-binding SYLF domain-containing protein
MRHILAGILFIAISLVTGACATTGGSSLQEKRQAVLAMRSEVLAELYRIKPQAKAEVASAPGYAVFSNANVNVILASFGGGYGVARDNRTGRDYFMKMGELGVGLGLGVKDFRAVFVFRSQSALDRFVNSGWEFGGHADAAAKASDKGGAVGGEALIGDITIYQLTKAGLALQATVKGTKYWKDDELN